MTYISIERQELQNAHPFLSSFLGRITYLFSFLLFLCTPLLYDSSLANAPFSSKTFFFIDALCLFSIVAMIKCLMQRSPVQFSFSPVDFVLILFLVFVFINRYLLHQYQGISLRVFELPALILLYTVLRTSLTMILYAMLAVSLAGCLLAVYGTIQLLGYVPFVPAGSSVLGGFSNSGPFAGYLAAIGIVDLGMYLFRDPICARLINSQQSRRADRWLSFFFKIIPVVSLATILILLPAARARAAWVALLTASILMLIFKNRGSMKFILNSFPALKKIAMLAVLITLVLAAWKLYRMKPDSAGGRLLVWKVSAQMIKDNPLTGVGYDRFRSHYMDAQARYLSQHRNEEEMQLADNSYYAFNEAIQLTVENGIIGLLLLTLIVFVCCSVKADDQNEPLQYIAYCTLLCIAVFGLFSYPMQVLNIKMLLVISLAILAVTDKRKFFFSSFRFDHRFAFRLVVLLIFSASLGWWAFEMNKVKQAYKNWQSALDAYDSGSMNKSIAAFEKAYPVLNTEGDFLMQYGKALSINNQNEKARQVLIQCAPYLDTDIIQTTLGKVYAAQGQLTDAETAYKKAAQMIPNRFYAEYLLARLYWDGRQPEKAAQKARELLNKPVKFQSAAIDEMREDMQKLLDRQAASGSDKESSKQMPIEKIKISPTGLVQ